MGLEKLHLWAALDSCNGLAPFSYNIMHDIAEIIAFTHGIRISFWNKDRNPDRKYAVDYG